MLKNETVSKNNKETDTMLKNETVSKNNKKTDTGVNNNIITSVDNIVACNVVDLKKPNNRPNNKPNDRLNDKPNNKLNNSFVTGTINRKKQKQSGNSVDAYVGTKLKIKRSEMGYSQNNLGNMVGVTFQQIQKYEKGTNRIGSGRLYEFAKILKVPVSYFYEHCEGTIDGVNGVISSCGELVLRENDVAEKEVVGLVKNFCQIKDKKMRKTICDLARRITREVSEEEEREEE